MINYNKFDIASLKLNYQQHPSYGLINIPEFLSDDMTQQCADELEGLQLDKGKHFTRKGSCMYEYNDLSITPVQERLVHEFHSSRFLHWLEHLTGVEKLLPDPHLVGAGYMKSFAGDSLKVHTDFNWVEEIHLHRAVSIIIYFNKDWDADWGGSLNFYDFKNEALLSSIKPDWGNMLVWNYHNLVYHGYPDPMTCPEDQSRKGIRLFYYQSRSKPDAENPPHRSLYWFNSKEKLPYDIRQKT
jgi:hypothetical protein